MRRHVHSISHRPHISEVEEEIIVPIQLRGSRKPRFGARLSEHDDGDFPNEEHRSAKLTGLGIEQRREFPGVRVVEVS